MPRTSKQRTDSLARRVAEIRRDHDISQEEFGNRIGSRVLNDLAIRIQLPWDTVFTAAIQNIFDKDPAFARTDINYDALTGDPLGRTIKLGIQKKIY